MPSNTTSQKMIKVIFVSGAMTVSAAENATVLLHASSLTKASAKITSIRKGRIARSAILVVGLAKVLKTTARSAKFIPNTWKKESA